jgi:hypothetical protein
MAWESLRGFSQVVRVVSSCVIFLIVFYSIFLIVLVLNKEAHTCKPKKKTNLQLVFGNRAIAPDFLRVFPSPFCPPAASRQASAAVMANPVRIELDKLSVEQLKGLKEQTDLEVNLLQDSLTKIRTANARFENASGALQDLSLRPQGKNPVPFFPAQRDSSALPFLRSVDLV